MSTVIAWFRGDLRVDDNPLLHLEPMPDQLLCVYVLDARWLEPLPGLASPRLGPARLRFLWESLMALRGELLKRGSDLLVRLGDPVDVVADLAERLEADGVRVRRDAGVDEERQLASLAARLAGRLEIQSFDGGLLFDAESLPTPVAELPGSYTAFRRRAETAWRVPPAIAAPVTLPPWPSGAPRGLPPLHEASPRASRWRPDGRGGFRFEGGEEAGLARLDHYLWRSDGLARYRQTRDGLMGAGFSSRLSPWLAQGCLSARRVHDALRAWEGEHGESESSHWLVLELLWRDYFHWAARQEGPALYGATRLPAADPGFRAWCLGETGMPLVDAAMGELAATGWLSNRARQNVASYLVFDLDGDWRLGAAWFEHCLIDYDAASNWGNWRYLAGVGRDPRERRFQVAYQAERYDPHGEYVAHWLPALADLPPGPGRHRPWRQDPSRFPPPSDREIDD